MDPGGGIDGEEDGDGEREVTWLRSPGTRRNDAQRKSEQEPWVFQIVLYVNE